MYSAIIQIDKSCTPAKKVIVTIIAEVGSGEKQHAKTLLHICCDNCTMPQGRKQEEKGGFCDNLGKESFKECSQIRSFVFGKDVL